MPSSLEPKWCRTLAVIGVALAAACSSDDSGEKEAALTCGDEELSYQSFGQPFFLSWCTGCHSSQLPDDARQGAPLDMNFDDLDSVRNHGAQILERVVNQRTMPPAGGPPESERARLKEWLECGAPGTARTFSAAPSIPAFTPPAGECAAPRDSLPDALLPRCTRATLECIQRCTGDENAVETCRNTCLALDPTPPALVTGFSVNCATCTLLQLLACGDRNGCHDPISSALCCSERECPAGSPDGCSDQRCPSEFRSLGLCIGYAAEQCFDFTSGDLGRCFAR